MIRLSLCVLVGLLSITARGAPVEEGVPCQIEPFEKSVFENSLLLENHLMCPVEGPTLGTAQFCEHLYKCPLDFSERTRHCEAVCKRDGTWDYKYPSCEDLVPLAEYFQLKLLEERWQKLEKRRRKRRRSARFDADAILKALEKREDENEENILIGDEPKVRIKKSAWVLVKPPTASEAPKVVEEPAELIETTPTPESTFNGRVSKAKLRLFCRKKMCRFLKPGMTCKTIDSQMADYQLQTKLCQMCVILSVCKTTVDMFSNG